MVSSTHEADNEIIFVFLNKVSELIQKTINSRYIQGRKSPSISLPLSYHKFTIQELNIITSLSDVR
jgi:hypothetical protein